MLLAPLDWLLIAGYFALSFGIAVYYFRRAGRNTSEFFLSGRNMPWWLAGTSMVATTFAADTPLAVTELVAQNGIAGNWLWWNFAFGGILTVFFFARLWRRSGVLTDVEFVEMRYDGKAAAVLRGVKAIYFGLVLNGIIIGWVALAMETVIDIVFPGLTVFGHESFHILGAEIGAPLVVVVLLMLLVGVYSLLSGLWGVVVTDAFQFVIAIAGSIILAVFVLDMPEVGGMTGLMAALPEETFRMLPTLGNAAEGGAVLTLTAASFFAYVGVQWWSSWYPGAEPGGGGYIAQRMMSAKDEKHSLLATLWFTVAHYCLRPWPWIIVALAALVLYPGLDDPREGFVLAMRDVLPPGLLGLMLAAFLAAFMSTLSTQLNWGASYLVNDFWKRFVKPNAGEKHYVLVSRVLTFALAGASVFITANLGSVSEAWGLLLTASAGLGLVLILRWYWWRVNAWSELAATLSPVFLLVLALILGTFGIRMPGLQAEFPNNLFAVTAFTTVVWVTATFLSRPTRNEVLDRFYRRIHPGGPGWKRIAERNPDVRQDTGMVRLAGDCVAGIVLVYCALFGTGHLLMGNTGWVLLCLGGITAAGAFLWRSLSRLDASAAAQDA
ncbi:MAG: Na+:solute symporter [Bacteroidetes bacterium SB0662_bin_6]|nr:Na+:solute symporter [Bacteroidetes bacterium SB0668_bin_1]MYE03707.1 Na+:solute symporter [Bacteroidetes bacterium SB0662_bin_6]